MSCQQSAIRAHSIPKFTAEGPSIEFKYVGRNDASTFTGLCAEHDARLFAPIDTKAFDAGDREHLFLLAYRSVTRELHAVMEGAVKIQFTYSSLVERGIESGTEASPAGITATQALLRSFFTYRYRERYFDALLLSHRFDAIEHDVIILEKQTPCIAVSSLLSVDATWTNDDFKGIVLNVMPIDRQTTMAIFSYAASDRPKATPILDRILSSN